MFWTSQLQNEIRQRRRCRGMVVRREGPCSPGKGRQKVHGTGNLHILQIAAPCKNTVSIQHCGNIGPTWGRLRPARPQLRPNLYQLAPTWAQLGSKMAQLGSNKWWTRPVQSEIFKTPIFTGIFHGFFNDHTSFEGIFPLLRRRWAQLCVKLSPKVPSCSMLELGLDFHESIWIAFSPT